MYFYAEMKITFFICTIVNIFLDPKNHESVIYLWSGIENVANTNIVGKTHFLFIFVFHFQSQKIIEEHLVTVEAPIIFCQSRFWTKFIAAHIKTGLWV